MTRHLAARCAPTKEVLVQGTHPHPSHPSASRHQARSVSPSTAALWSAKSHVSRRNRSTNLRASFSDNGSATPGGFETPQGDDSLVQVSIDKVESAKSAASVLYLSIKDGSGSVLPVYVGEAESLALEMELSKNKVGSRPIMYDLFKTFIVVAGYKLNHVIINDLKSKTYHAKIYFAKEGTEDTIELDCRPSDALNLAVRCEVDKIFVTKKLISKAKPFIKKPPEIELPKVNELPKRSAPPLTKEEKEEIERKTQLMVELQLRLSLAVKEERFQDAAKHRDALRKTFMSLKNSNHH